MTKNILTDIFTEPLNSATNARIYIHAGDGNLTIDRLISSEQVLADGALQYFEKQGQPHHSLVSNQGQATLTLKGGAAGQPWFRLPWAACNGATEWQIHLNPTVSSDITAHSDGGNIKVDLTDMAITGVSVDTGGGNIDLVLPTGTAQFNVVAKTGAGNVTVHIPSDIAVSIQVTTGLGKAIVDQRFSQVGKNVYRSPDFDDALGKVEIIASSGAGNVIVNSR